jgi:hypothetical protein
MTERYRLPPQFRIVSGGQSGADEAALDWAIAHGVAHGGWCPKGRRAEHGTIDPRYLLTETPHAVYRERTEWNVRDSDATVIFSLTKKLVGGSKLTASFADKYEKPWLHVLPDSEPKLLAQFLERNRVVTLNLAGPRASTAPDIGELVTRMLDQALEVPTAKNRGGHTARPPSAQHSKQ